MWFNLGSWKWFHSSRGNRAGLLLVGWVPGCMQTWSMPKAHQCLPLEWSCSSSQTHSLHLLVEQRLGQWCTSYNEYTTLLECERDHSSSQHLSQNGYPPTALPLRYGRDWENFIFLILTLIIWKVQVSLTLILRKFLPSLVGIFGRPQIWPQSTMASIHGGLSPPGLSPPGLNSPGFNPAVTDLNWQKQEKLSFSQENW